MEAPTAKMKRGRASVVLKEAAFFRRFVVMPPESAREALRKAEA